MSFDGEKSFQFSA